ncbi:hypothetical protein ACFOWU_05315 [Epilithonimonas zeae]|uniref:Uncharacterized protein n=1 Tax=Epilithonimonas zeae TaxID=1416779 RepID=A0A1N6F8B0_9FLAO|nr:hypothetical protein [Epilithonimonas zeae]SIN91523.1 hypothetical protein SAMN05444409_1118 [Epilithonimonas zeae]
MSDGLHIQLLTDKSDQNKFDASFGSLTLPQAGNFVVKVREYEEEFLKKQKKFDDNLRSAEAKWKERAQAGWTREKLEENWKANEAQRNASDKAEEEKLKAKFVNVNWIWCVAPKKLNPSELSHNESFSKGIHGKGEYNLKFPKILEGGGMAYLEAFQPEVGAKGAKPFGIFVQATGTPRIVRVEWTDFDYNLLKGKKVAFNSEVLLHIYTEALYGQELEINLFDEDIFSDDQLDVAKASGFQREVNIHKVHPKEIGKPGVADTLVKSEQENADQKIEKEHYLQKVTIEVKVDYGWMKLAGSNLKIYPTVKSLKTGKYFEDFSREFLEVSKDGVLYDVAKEVSNMPVLQSEIETNIAAYHPCQYTALDFINEKGETKNIYKEEQGVSQNENLEIGIIVGSDPKKFSFKTDDNADATECRFDGAGNDHDKNIFTYDRSKLPKNISITSNQPKVIEGTAFFDYDRMNMMKYFWLPNDFKNAQRYSHLKINAMTCRHQVYPNITILPDIEWELAFIITTMAGFRIKAENTTFTRLSQGLGEYQFRGIKAEQAGKLIEKGGVGYSLNIKYTINGGAFYEQISLDFVRNIEKIIDTYNKIAGFVAIFKGDDDSVTSAAISTSAIKKITFDIDPPSVVFLLRWKYDYAKKNGQAVVNFFGAAGFKPLIGLKIGVDLVANADKFGGLVGAIITWGAKFVKKLTKMDLYILVETGVALNYDIGLSYNEIDGFAPNTKQKIVVDLTFSIKAGIKRKDVVFVANVDKMEGNVIPMSEAEQETFKVEGAATTGIRYTEEHGFEKGKGSYKTTDVKWLGAEMTITIVTMSHNRRQNGPPNEQFKEKFLIKGPEQIYGPEKVYTKNE